MKKPVNALLEIGCEEIPARFMPGFLSELKSKAEEKLKAERVSFSKVIVLGTCRRLTLFIENISPKADDLLDEVKGPPAEIAYDPSGNPTQAAMGFVKSQGGEIRDLSVKEVGKRKYAFLKVLRRGERTEKILRKLFPEVISALYQPLSMRWGEIDYKFIRPIHWFLSLYGNKTIKFELAGITSAELTHGHRFLAKNKAVVLKTADIEAYKKLLRSLGVIVDQAERKTCIRKAVESSAEKTKAKVLWDESLLEEINYLVEDVVAFKGRFNPAFLEIPQEVLITSMKKNQKYFPLADAFGKLLPKFAVVSNGCRNLKIVEGNEKVLAARLTDAKFFFEEDKKVSLTERNKELAGIAFFEKLGTIADKVERLIKLSAFIGKNSGFSDGELKVCMRIAQLCKADLPTRMVYEFPELQGIIGKEYARISGEDPKVAHGIAEHYLPRFAEDKLPDSPWGAVVAIADRVDSLVGCFSIGEVPTGSEDPYGLRRAGHALIRLILEKKMHLSLAALLAQDYKLFEQIFSSISGKKAGLPKDLTTVKRELLEFLAIRLKTVFFDKQVRYDVAEAVLAEFDDIFEAMVKAEVINKLVATDQLKGVVATADRIARIVKGEAREEVIEGDLMDATEKGLFALYSRIKSEIDQVVKGGDWEKAVQILSVLTDPVEKFFIDVLVMHEDEKLRLNRLALLGSIEKLYLEIADFKKIVV